LNIYKDLRIEINNKDNCFVSNMTITKQLLTLKNPLLNGVVTDSADGYRIHQTEAGLYFLLEHDKDGSVHFTWEKGCGGVSSGGFEYSGKFPNGFIPTRIAEIQGSVIKSKSTKDIAKGIKFFYQYDINREGQIEMVKVGYGPSNDHFKSSFKVTEEGVEAKLLSIKPYLSGTDGLVRESRGSEDLWSQRINYEVTLKNFLQMMEEDASEETVKSLFSLDFVVLDLFLL
jgi:hypothetical protein